MPLPIAFIYSLLFFLSFSEVVIAASPALTGDNVLVLYKASDEQSKQVADYYSEQRHIPKSQLVAIDIKGSPNIITSTHFTNINKQLAKYLKPNIKVIVLAWHAPYRVECMSITSAFTLGFDQKYCSKKSSFSSKCSATAISPFYNAPNEKLWQENSLRLTMMLSGKTFQQAKSLIDRGVSSDNTQPSGRGFLVRTSDAARSTRWPIFKQLVEYWPKGKGVDLHYLDERFLKGDTLIKNKKDVLFYLTGAVHVPKIDTNIATFSKFWLSEIVTYPEQLPITLHHMVVLE